MIDSKLMQKFLKSAINTLEGEWILIGGTLLPLLGIDHRVTMDIDLINLDLKSTTAQSLQLMKIAESLKLPVESINQAGAFFLSKISDDELRNHLVLVGQSESCKIFRPDFYLFVKLKIARLSQSDYEDCLVFVENFKEECNAHQKKLSTLLKQQMRSASSEKQGYLSDLLRKINKL